MVFVPNSESQPLLRPHHLKCLILCRGRLFPVHSQMRQKCNDLRIAHFLGMQAMVIPNQPDRPVFAGFGRSRAIVAQSHLPAQLLSELDGVESC